MKTYRSSSGKVKWLPLFTVLLSISFFARPEILFGRSKISVQSAEKLEEYSKVYVLPIGNDFRKVQPRLLERLTKTGFHVFDLQTHPLPFASQGTGFLISREGDVLTCAHVTGKESRATLWINETKYTGKVVAIDTNLDAAVIRIEGTHPPLYPLTFGSDSKIGQDVFTMGFPLANVLGSKPRLNKGMVSSTVGIHDNPKHLQISTPVQPGNSGGPLLNDQGQVLGMVAASLNSAKLLILEGSVPQNVNFAIKSEQLLGFLKQAGISLSDLPPGSATNSPPKDVFEDVGKSVVLVRGGFVDEERLKEHPLLCRCSYVSLRNERFGRLRLDFVDLHAVNRVLTLSLTEASTSTENKVLDEMFEEIAAKFFPDRPNPFNPKRSNQKKTAK